MDGEAEEEDREESEMSKTADKRSVSTDALETLGTIIGDGAGRDAIHIAVEPVVAGQKLYPGQDVGLLDGLAFSDAEHLGIVDPFLKAPVMPEERFWLLVYPRQITSLRHVWEHPAFDSESIGTSCATISMSNHIVKSREWIANHAEMLGLSTKALCDYAERWLDFEDYTIQDGSEHWRDSFNAPEFWHHYEILTGKTVSDDLKTSFFCCTC